MANEQSGIPLRRWRPFYSAFGAIDDAIQAAGHPRAAFLDVRARIVKLLRAAEDDGVAEQLCAALDDAMAEALETLRVAPVPRSALASTDLARAVAALRNHGSARIRGLVSDVLRGWRVAIDGDVASATAAKEELDKLRGSLVPVTAAAEGHEKNLCMPPAKVLPAAAAEAHEKKLHKTPAKMLPRAAATTATVEVHKNKLPMPPAPAKIPTATVVAIEEHKNKLFVPLAKKPVVSQRGDGHRADGGCKTQAARGLW